MKSEARPQEYRPATRHDEVVVESVEGEVILYDLRRHKAHALNETAAQVWQWCDGETPVATIAARAGETWKLDAEQAEALVWLSLQRFAAAKLLTGKLPDEERPVVTRRNVLKVIGAATLLPVVYTMAAPGIAEAATQGYCQQRCAGRSGTGACHSTTTCGSLGTIINFNSCVSCCLQGGRGWDTSFGSGCTVTF